MKTLNVVIETGMLIDVSKLSEGQVNDLDQALRDNEITPEEAAKKYDLVIRDTHHDAQVTLDIS